ncbi:5'-nucleotidase C-terminal domain-containing protein [Sediminibacterium goheungense]|uniref:5'-nucleotidase-like protein n=1 Tax=Sediminibacterium goheungense TaxID=1086393 RepID=A0A4R6IWT4_9BACT|nr:5'-nucleotidase C-terminal domain-containing protein [Sediminibacterium goheungense]TDO27184.1 5'-nucleotidase-like protein [Sediminibacterium goheungense]
MYRRKYIFYCLIILLSSCSSFYQPVSLQHTQYRIEPSLKKDSAMIALLMPYAKDINATMNKVIGISGGNYNNNRPESEIGNFLADAYLQMASEKFGRKVDAGFMNAGGVRSYLSKGNITVGKIFEIMPFDNILVLQELKGSVLQAYLDKMAEDGGWPVSKGVTMVIRNKKATQVMINGKPLDANTVYVVAHSDYIANGGGDCDMLRSVPQINKGYLMRDAIIDYVTKLTAEGKTIQPLIENRVTNAQ